MPIFEQYFAQIPAEVTRIPHADVRGITDVGAGLEARAKAELGEAITDAAVIVAKWYEREGNTQFDTQRRLARERINEFELMIFDDTAGHDAEYKKMRTDVSKLAPKNNIGASKFKNWFDLQSPDWDNMSAEKKIRMVARNNQTEYFKNIANIALEKDFASARAEAMLLTQGAVDDRTRTPAQAASDFDRIMDEWTKADVWRRATSAVRPDGEVDWEAAAKWFDVKENIEGLPESIVKGFANTAHSRARTQKAEGKVELERDRIAAGNNFLKRITEKNFAGLKDDIINSILLPTGDNSKKMWLDTLDNTVKAVNNAKNNIITSNETNIKIDRLLRNVRNGNTTYDEAIRIYSDDISKDVNAKEGESNLDDINAASEKAKDPILNTLSAQRARGSFGRLRNIEIAQLNVGAVVDEEDLVKIKEVEDRWLRINNEYDAYLLSEEGRKATDEQRLNKKQALEEPVVEEVTFGWFEKLLFTSPLIGAGKLLLTKRELKKAEEAQATRPTTQAEFDAIPIGAIFIDTDGKRKIKQ